jgi:AcrR family transcriptional regulator
MKPSESSPAVARMLAVVTKMLETGGTDAVQLAAVANKAKVSMTTIYKNFPSRDELILSAVAGWMDSHVYRPLDEPPSDVPLLESLMWQFRHLYEPWERHPRMAESFVRARFGPGGDRLLLQGVAAVQPVTLRLLQDADPAYAEDISMILEHVVHSMFIRFAAGEAKVTDIMPVIERTVLRLTVDVQAPKSIRRTAKASKSKALGPHQ